jgi:RNA polymerase sigma-70 factor (ECF subfamily)
MSKELDRAEGLRKEDAVLVKDFKAGNRTSFDELVLRHKDRVFNVCYKFLGDYQEADDSAQETFVKVYRSLRRFRFEATFSTWLYRIAVNTCKNKLTSSEHRHRKKMVRLDNPGESEGTAHGIEIRDENQSPLIELERKERLSLIQKAIESLPIEQKTVVVLRDIEGVSYEDIAHITGDRLGTVKSRLARARLELKEKLSGVI